MGSTPEMPRTETTREVAEDLPAERAYWDLVRRLSDLEREIAADELLAPVLSASGRTRDQLQSDVTEARERRRLIQLSSLIPTLEAQCEVAREGCQLVQQAAEKARSEADRREGRAVRVKGILESRLKRAHQAEQQLLEILPQDQAQAWEKIHAQLREVRALILSARQEGLSLEHLEAALEYAEANWLKIQSSSW